MLFVYLPTRMHFANRLLNGEFPEWYPFDGLGSSYIGNVVTSLLHPTVLLHLILPHPLALNLSVVLMYYVAALGAFFFFYAIGIAVEQLRSLAVSPFRSANVWEPFNDEHGQKVCAVAIGVASCVVANRLSARSWRRERDRKILVALMLNIDKTHRHAKYKFWS